MREIEKLLLKNKTTLHDNKDNFLTCNLSALCENARGLLTHRGVIIFENKKITLLAIQSYLKIKVYPIIESYNVSFSRYAVAARSKDFRTNCPFITEIPSKGTQSRVEPMQPRLKPDCSVVSPQRHKMMPGSLSNSSSEQDMSKFSSKDFATSRHRFQQQVETVRYDSTISRINILLSSTTIQQRIKWLLFSNNAATEGQGVYKQRKRDKFSLMRI